LSARRRKDSKSLRAKSFLYDSGEALSVDMTLTETELTARVTVGVITITVIFRVGSINQREVSSGNVGISGLQGREGGVRIPKCASRVERAKTGVVSWL